MAAWLDRRIATREETDRRADRAAGVLVVVALVGAILALTFTAGNPFSEARDYWNEFKEGGTTPSAGEARLTGTAATDRYDFWRVGIEMFGDRPLTGYGADNFQHEYFVRGKSEQQPRYPHSLEVRALAQTGIVGALLLAGALVAAFLAAARALWARADLTAAVAAGALLSVAYWLVHGSLDWFWEFAGLGAIAFAALGLAAGLGDGLYPAEGRAEAEPAAGCAGAGRGMRGRSVARCSMALGAVRAPGRLLVALGRGFRVPLAGPRGVAQPTVAGSRPDRRNDRREPGTPRHGAGSLRGCPRAGYDLRVRQSGTWRNRLRAGPPRRGPAPTSSALSS